MKIRTWRTYKKNDNPEIRYVQDSVFNKPIVIQPTLRFNGYTTVDIDASEVFFDDKKPKELVVEYFKNFKKEVIDVVYYYWWGRSGVCSIFITIGYKFKSTTE